MTCLRTSKNSNVNFPKILLKKFQKWLFLSKSNCAEIKSPTLVSLALLLWKPQTFAWCCGSNWPYLAWYKVRGHSITTWKGFDHFWPPFPLTGTILFNPIPHGFWTDIATFVGSFWPALLVSSATQWIAMPSSKTCTQIRSFIFRHHFVSLFQQSRKSDPPFLSVKLDFCLCIKTSKIRKTPLQK